MVFDSGPATGAAILLLTMPARVNDAGNRHLTAGRADGFRHSVQEIDNRRVF